MARDPDVGVAGARGAGSVECEQRKIALGGVRAWRLIGLDAAKQRIRGANARGDQPAADDLDELAAIYSEIRVVHGVGLSL